MNKPDGKQGHAVQLEHHGIGAKTVRLGQSSGTRSRCWGGLTIGIRSFSFTPRLPEERREGHRPMRDWTIYRCILCSGSALGQESAFEVKCEKCGARFPLRENILDTLIEPSPKVIAELQGMANERGIGIDNWREVKIDKRFETVSFAERSLLTENLAGQYYQQTLTNFDQAFERILPAIQNRGGSPLRVLEIGSERDYVFLERFRQIGAECFALNVLFLCKAPNSFRDWPEKTLGDMNMMPYNDGVFDVVMFSATSHHSSDLAMTIGELSRVLKRGGGLILNDPIRGHLKFLGVRLGQHHRDSYINENEYTIRFYHRLFRHNRLRPEYLFSAYHDRKLCAADIHPQLRFAKLSRLIAAIWKFAPVRNFARNWLPWPGSLIFGLPLNVILHKT